MFGKKKQESPTRIPLKLEEPVEDDFETNDPAEEENDGYDLTEDDESVDDIQKKINQLEKEIGIRKTAIQSKPKESTKRSEPQQAQSKVNPFEAWASGVEARLKVIESALFRLGVSN